MDEFLAAFPSFYRQTGMDQILTLAWYSEVKQGRKCFGHAHMRKLFREASAEPPNLSLYIPRLQDRTPPDLLKEGDGWRLSGKVRMTLDKRYGEQPTTARVSKILADLVDQIPDLDERVFLKETLACYQAQAFRASVVMAWNLAYGHLMRWVVASDERLTKLNDGIIARHSAKSFTVADLSELRELKESPFIGYCQSGGLISKNQAEILTEKLKKRNAAAHPSNVTVTQHQADDVISDLVLNVVLALT
jgi:hypothetical protein